jgi:hypothetical protein
MQAKIINAKNRRLFITAPDYKIAIAQLYSQI